MITFKNQAWMAGIIDLKGRLLYKSNPTRKSSRQITLSVETSVAAVTKRLAAMTGTSPEAKSRKPLSEMLRRQCTEHCPDAHVHVDDHLHMPAVSRWTISGAGMIVVLEGLEPYLCEDTWLGFADGLAEARSKVSFNGRGAYAVLSCINRLHALGWALNDQFEEALMAKTVLGGDEPPDDELEAA